MFSVDWSYLTVLVSLIVLTVVIVRAALTMARDIWRHRP